MKKSAMLLIVAATLTFFQAKTQMNTLVTSPGGTFNVYMAPNGSNDISIVVNNLTGHEIPIMFRFWDNTQRRFPTPLSPHVIYQSQNYLAAVNGGVIFFTDPIVNQSTTFPWSVWIFNNEDGDFLILTGN